jgi:predicted acetyltransferase
MLYAGGQLMTHVGVLERHTVMVGELPVNVSGIAGVVTVGEAHGRGYASTAMLHAHDMMREMPGVEFGLLFCFDRRLAFYERLGWAKVDAPVHVDQPSGRTLMPVNTMVLPLGEREWPAGTVELGSLPW